MAWLTAVPLTRPRRGEYGSAAGRGGAESQTVAGEGGLGAAPRASREPAGSFYRSDNGDHCFCLTSSDRSERLAGHLFQQAAPFSEPVPLLMVSGLACRAQHVRYTVNVTLVMQERWVWL